MGRYSRRHPQNRTAYEVETAQPQSEKGIVLMADPQEPKQPQPKPGAKKGVSIQIMFPCESDKVAIGIKAQIDAVVKDIEEKRYTFSISEV